MAPGFWEKFYFRPGNLGYPVFDLGFAKIGVYICYDRHFPEGARCLGLNGAEIVFNPSATVAGLERVPVEAGAAGARGGQWILSLRPSIAWAPRRRGTSASFTGRATFAIRAGRLLPQASRDKDEVLTADLNLDEIAEVRRTWQFYRDRRPDMYGPLVV